MNSHGLSGGHETDADLESYLDIEGVTAAALASADGLVVAAAGDRELDLEALAVHAAAALSSARGLASDAGIRAPRFIALDLVERAIILAPLTDELFLVITGGRRILSLPAESNVFP